jgi:hypothetical protein
MASKELDSTIPDTAAGMPGFDALVLAEKGFDNTNSPGSP